MPPCVARSFPAPSSAPSYFALLGNYAFAAATGGRLGGEAGAIDPLSATWAALACVFWSLLLFGWLTLPAGAALGAGYAKWRRDRGRTPNSGGTARM
jgi:hypothetical protein